MSYNRFIYTPGAFSNLGHLGAGTGASFFEWLITKLANRSVPHARICDRSPDAGVGRDKKSIDAAAPEWRGCP